MTKSTEYTDEEVTAGFLNPVNEAHQRRMEMYLATHREYQRQAKIYWIKQGLKQDEEGFRNTYNDAIATLCKKLKLEPDERRNTIIAFFMGIFKYKVLEAKESFAKNKIKNSHITYGDETLENQSIDTPNWEEEHLTSDQLRSLIKAQMGKIAGSSCGEFLGKQLDGATPAELMEAFKLSSMQAFYNKVNKCKEKIQSEIAKHPELLKLIKAYNNG